MLRTAGAEHQRQTEAVLEGGQRVDVHGDHWEKKD